MPDVFDQAQEREQQERDAAIMRVRLDARDDQRPAGQTECQFCEKPIPPERVAILPGATCCVRCQTLRDRAAAPSR
jgi:phage/conjugal plasmid C-4 type zinc finger TraR family protein